MQIKIDGLEFGYSSTPVLNDITLDLSGPKFVSIMGPNGVGKSTLIHCINKILTPTSGTVMLDGKDVSTLSESDRIKLRKGALGFVFQSFNLIDELNVSENIELPLLYMGVSAKERKEAVKAVIDRVAMGHRAKHFPAQLSGGQQQRVAIARAVISNPKLILADEPTGNLDSKNGREVMELLKELHREGTTIVMVTHSQRDASYADRVVNLFDGQIVNEVEM